MFGPLPAAPTVLHFSSTPTPNGDELSEIYAALLNFYTWLENGEKGGRILSAFFH